MTKTLREAAQMALDAFEDRYTTPEGRAAIESLRAALTEDAQWGDSQVTKPEFVAEQKAKTESLRAALAQPEQEPVAWLYKKKDGMQVITDDPDYADGTWTPLYTTPPQRDEAPAKAVEWQGLTDEEIEQIHYGIKCKGIGAYSTNDIYRAIEAKLKEKNGG